MKDHIISLIRSSGLARVAEDLADLLRPAVVITEQEATAAGCSAFGGTAEFPAGLTPPTWRGEPLPLIASFQLAELRAFDRLDELPREGRLLFFFEASALEDYPPDPGSWSVIHCPEPSAGEMAAPHVTPATEAPPLRGMRYTSRLTLPPLESSAVEALALDQQESDVYADLLENVDLLFDAPETHQLLGHPCQVQGDLQQECLDDTGRGSAPEDWRLLLQLTESKDMIWGDAGVVYFFVRRQALREADFSDVHVVMQCG